MIERVVWIGFVKQVNEAVNHGVDVQDRFPVLSQDIQTNFSLQVNVRMVDLRLALNLGR